MGPTILPLHFPASHATLDASHKPPESGRNNTMPMLTHPGARWHIMHVVDSTKRGSAHLVRFEQPHADLHPAALPVRHLVEAPLKVDV